MTKEKNKLSKESVKFAKMVSYLPDTKDEVEVQRLIPTQRGQTPQSYTPYDNYRM